MATVLQLIIDTVSEEDLGKLLNHVTQDKYWQFTPLMIAIENEALVYFEVTTLFLTKLRLIRFSFFHSIFQTTLR